MAGIIFPLQINCHIPFNFIKLCYNNIYNNYVKVNEEHETRV